MLDDLNKIVPELDNNDKNKIYNNINNKMNNKKPKNIFNFKIALAVASFAILLAILIPVGIFMNANNKGNNPINTTIPIETITTPVETITTNQNGNSVNYNSRNFTTTESLLGVAAFRAFDTKTNNTNLNNNLKRKQIYYSEESNNQNASSKDPSYFSYPFDYVKIENAYKFETEVSDINNSLAKEIIETNCGLGKLEVVIAKFSTYIGDSSFADIEDTLISIRGYNGYYTILLNGLRNNYSDEGLTSTEYSFSSHKKISSKEVIKDLTQPIIRIHVIKYNDGKIVIGFFGCKDKNTESDIANFQFFNTADNIVYISPDYLYSVLELSKIKTKQVEATITDIDLENNILFVQTDNNLTMILIEEYTEANISNYIIGDVIIVEYDNYYESYDPKIVVANKITKVEKFEEDIKSNE